MTEHVIMTGMDSPDEIRALRNRLGLTQTQFAHALGTSQVSVSQWELGKVKPIRMAVLAMQRLSEQSEQSGHRAAEPEPVYNAG
jgi:DNA-binding transcriptional regulator YiaG